MATTGRKTTIKDLAETCGVSIATVSRVLNNIEGGYSAETASRIRQAAEEMGYVPNPMARSLVTKQSNLIAVLVPDIHYYFFQEFFSGLEEFFNPLGYRLLLCNTQEKQEQENWFIRELCNGQVNGIIVSTLNSKEDNTLLIELKKNHFPIVMLERYGDDTKGFCKVEVDNFGAGAAAVNYLVSKGHKKIAFIKGRQDAKNAEIRYQGFASAMTENALNLDPVLVKYGNYSFEGGLTATKELIEEGNQFTALVCANDMMTLGACKAILKEGLRIPQDISVVSLDRTIMTDTYEPSIVSVDLCARAASQMAAECLLRLMQGKRMKKNVFVQRSQFCRLNSVKKIQT